MKNYCLFIVFSLVFLSAKSIAQPFVKTPVGFETEINAFLKADSVSFPAKGGYLFVGSSTIRRWDNLKEHFAGLHLLQRGFGGSNMNALNYYAPYIVLPYKPDTIVVYEGDNDLAGLNTKPEAFIASCDTFIHLVRRSLPKTFIYFISIKPSPSRQQYAKLQDQANKMLQELVAKNPRTGFIDIRPLMYKPNGDIREEYFEKDKLHVNDGCYRLWADEIKRQMKLNK
jgi:lysophospholipase L1-like esterase